MTYLAERYYNQYHVYSSEFIHTASEHLSYFKCNLKISHTQRIRQIFFIKFGYLLLVYQFYYSLLVVITVYHGSNPSPWHKKKKVDNIRNVTVQY
jgi:hypothetical protein